MTRAIDQLTTWAVKREVRLGRRGRLSNLQGMASAGASSVMPGAGKSSKLSTLGWLPRWKGRRSQQDEGGPCRKERKAKAAGEAGAWASAGRSAREEEKGTSRLGPALCLAAGPAAVGFVAAWAAGLLLWASS